MSGRPGLAGFIGAWGSWILRGVVGFAALFLGFAWLKFEGIFTDFIPPARHSFFDWRFLAAHFVAFGAFCLVSFRLYGSTLPDIAAILWLALGIAAIILGTFSVIGADFWIGLARKTGYLWLGALGAIVVACVAGNSSRGLWPWAAGITFRMVFGLLRPVLPGLMADAATRTIGTARFNVEIAPECSGLEGVGLILVFGLVWILLFRKQYRFPQTLILLPLGVGLIFAMNSIRIAALILLGNAGAEKVALGGFHSQAGWMIFNVVALGFSIAASKTPWLRINREIPQQAAVRYENPTAAWLMPFVAILAAGMLSRAMTADFEWAYPLRFVAAVVALFAFRQTYRTIDWRVSWLGPVTGIIVFAIWIGFDRAAPAMDGMPAALAAASPVARNLWLIFRVLAGAVTVPIAEELAFRGFLYRRLLSQDFTAVPLQRLVWWAVVASSVIFGFLHGGRWFVGAIAGACYALVMIRRGRIADAIVAHGVTNALLAADVLMFQHWHLW